MTYESMEEDDNEGEAFSFFIEEIWNGCLFDGLNNAGEWVQVYKSESERMKRGMKNKDVDSIKVSSRVLSSLLDPPIDCIAWHIVSESSSGNDMVGFKSFAEFITGCEKIWRYLHDGNEPDNDMDELIFNMFRCAMYNCWNLHSIHGVASDVSNPDTILWQYPEWARFGHFLTIFGFDPPPVNGLRQDKWVRSFGVKRRTNRITL